MDKVQQLALRAVAIFVGWIAVSAFSTEPLAEFPIQEYDELLYVDVDVEGKQHTFILDSGCSGMMLHEKAFGAEIPNGAVEVTDAHGVAEQWPTIPSPLLRFGRASTPAGQLAVISDLDRVSFALGREISGFLGLPLFSAYVVQANTQQGRLALLDPAIAVGSKWGKEVAVTLDGGGLPCIPLRLPDGTVEEVLIDTGANGHLSLQESVFRRLIASKDLSLQPAATSITFGAHGAMSHQGGSLLACELAGFRLNGVPVSESSDGSSIGMGLLRRFDITFDLRQKRVYLAANKSLNDGWPRKDCSVGVGQQDGRTTVIYTVLGSRASSSGLQFGDELRVINGESISDWPLGRIRKVLREAESDLNLEVLRAGETKEIVLPRG